MRSFGRVKGPPSTGLAIRAGMIFLLVGQVLGGLILANQFSGSGSIANASIVGAAGELKVPHALALHGLQVLAVLDLILERAPVPARAALIAVGSCVVGYGLFLAATLQTYSGLGPLALTPITLLVAGAGAVLIAGPYLRALSAALRRPSLA